MVRRSFKVGLQVGLLLGVVVAAVKLIQSRRSHDEPAPPAWTPAAPEPTSPAAPARPRIAEEPAPPVATDDRPRDEVGEPIEEPSPEAAPSTAHRADDGATGSERPSPAATPAKRSAKKAASKTAKKAAKAAKKADRAWVEPSDGTCPPSHPLKAKLASKIFHKPGGLSYDRTSPDRCYADEAAAEGDGLRAAKR